MTESRVVMYRKEFTWRRSTVVRKNIKIILRVLCLRLINDVSVVNMTDSQLTDGK